MKIYFCQTLPKQGTGKYIHYYFRNYYCAGWCYLDLKKFVYNHIDSWLDDLNEWHGQLCNVAIRKVKNWWFTSASRITGWTSGSSIYESLFFAVAVIKYCEQENLDSLYVVDAPKEVLNYIKVQKPEWVYNTSFNVKEYRNIFRQFISNLKLLALPWKYIIELFGRSILNINKTIPKGKKFKTAIYSHILGLNTFKHSGDHYFGNMFDDDFILGKEDILWIYYSTSTNRIEENKLIESLRKKGKNAIILQEILTPLDLFSFITSILRYKLEVRLLKKQIPIPVIGDVPVKAFVNTFYHNMIINEPPLVEIELYMVFKKILGFCSFNSIIYPFEDKGLERAIIKACGDNRATIGYAHPAQHKGHLYLKKRSSLMPPRPSFIACTGQEAKKWLRHSSQIMEEKLLVIGTKRYIDVLERIAYQKNSKLRVLLLIGQDYETGMMANLVEADSSIFDGCELIVRKHPFVTSFRQEEGLHRLKKYIFDMQEEGGPLLQQIKRCDVAIFASTSAGIEAILGGRIGIYVDMHHMVPLDALEGRDNLTTVFRCSGADELKLVLNKIKQMDHQSYKKFVSLEREVALGVYMPSNTNELFRIIS